VAQHDGVEGSVVREGVNARDRPRADGSDGELAIRIRGPPPFPESLGGSGWRIHLLGMVLFDDEPVELTPAGESPGEVARSAKEDLNADREVGGVHQGPMALPGQHRDPG